MKVTEVQNNQSIEFSSFQFPGGESHIKFVHQYPHGGVYIQQRIRNGDDLMLVLLAVDALTRMGAESRNITLSIPYLPYARQDRVMVDGEPFSLKVFSQLINNLNLYSVEVFDPHSDVGPALLDRCVVIPNTNAVQDFVAENSIRDFTLISPDAGAYKKTSKLGEYFRAPVVIASKKRDVSTGALSGCEIHGDVAGRPCLIVDDICDGGRTFLQLADALKSAEAGDLHLFVSHGIFSNGFDALRERFKTIGTTNSFRENYPDFITTIDIGKI